MSPLTEYIVRRKLIGHLVRAMSGASKAAALILAT
jgi:hypothetical protein